jgi:hypothetical protein
LDGQVVRRQRRRFTCIAGCAISDTQARVAAPKTVQIDTLTLGAKQLPTEHFADYSFVFN